MRLAVDGMNPFALTIGGKRWTVTEGNPGAGNWACCLHDERKIVIRRGGLPTERASFVTHEVIHAAIPDLAEDAVARAETAIVTALSRAGLLASDD